MVRPVIIDTDPGIDDALAIFLAAASPELDILGIVAVSGNVGIEHTAPNVAALVDLLGLDCAVGRGASAPLVHRDARAIPTVHGTNGLAGYLLPVSSRLLEAGVPLMVRLIEGSEEPVTLIAIGPLTDLALLMTEYPETARKLERIIIMGGGTLDVPGNITPAAEFNIHFDPDAAARVFDFGVPITMVGVNVTTKALVGSAHLTRLLASGGPVADIVSHMIAGYHSDVRTDDDAAAQHDSLAVAAAINPAILTTRQLFVDVENAGRLTTGMTVVDYGTPPGSGNVDVAFDLDVALFRNLVDERLAALDATLKVQQVPLPGDGGRL